MPNPVIVADLEARFRPLSDEERTVGQALLDDSWAVLVTVIPDLNDRLLTGATSTGLAVSVVSAMALRVLRNPEGIRQWSIDDASFTRDSTLSAGGLYASPDEIALLSGRAGATRRGAFSVAPGRESAPAPASEAEVIDRLRYGRRW